MKLESLSRVLWSLIGILLNFQAADWAPVLLPEPLLNASGVELVEAGESQDLVAFFVLRHAYWALQLALADLARGF